MTSALDPLIAVDVGNSRVKLGRFDAVESSEFPEPTDVAEFDATNRSLESELSAWLSGLPDGSYRWRTASVNRPTGVRMIDWISASRAGEPIEEIGCKDLHLAVPLPQPERVGIDRLLAAVAVNRLRPPSRSAVIVDLGSAITVDSVSTTGEFLGGAILPGIRMSARALHEQTDLLPDLEIARLADPPVALGTSTTGAIESGIFWGAVGAIRELIAQMSDRSEDLPMIVLTGGAAPPVARLLREDARFVPHLVLAGIALAENPGPRIPAKDSSQGLE